MLLLRVLGPKPECPMQFDESYFLGPNKVYFLCLYCSESTEASLPRNLRTSHHLDAAIIKALAMLIDKQDVRSHWLWLEDITAVLDVMRMESGADDVG